MTRAPTDRSHLSIGEVLSLLQDEFPDVTISKIRFLESQGLLDPERTPSGYRKFYEADIDRLRWILRQQKDHYLPLKVIKDRLDEVRPVRTAPTAASPADLAVAEGAEPPAASSVNGDAPPGSGRGTHSRLATVALDERAPAGSRAASLDAGAPAGGTAPRPAPTGAGFPDVAGMIEGPVPRPGAGSSGRSERRPQARDAGRAPGGAPSNRRQAGPGDAASEDRSISLTLDELVQASGLPGRALRELEGFGLIESHAVGDTSYYDEDALVVARTAAGFLEHGIEARHIRSYKVAAEREAGLFEQIVLPLLKQRNPEARRRATQTVAELMRLGDEMRGVLLRRGLRDHVPLP